MKYSQVIQLNALLEKLAAIEMNQKTNTLPLSVQTRIKLSRLLRSVSRAFAEYNTVRIGLVRQYGEEMPDGQVRVTDPEKFKAFEKKLTELQQSDAEVRSETFKDTELADGGVPFVVINALAEQGVVE